MLSLISNVMFSLTLIMSQIIFKGFKMFNNENADNQLSRDQPTSREMGRNKEAQKAAVV